MLIRNYNSYTVPIKPNLTLFFKGDRQEEMTKQLNFHFEFFGQKLKLDDFQFEFGTLNRIQKMLTKWLCYSIIMKVIF